MSSIILDAKFDNKLQPAFDLWQQYKPEAAPFAFRAKTLIQAQQWQVSTRKELGKVIGIRKNDNSPFHPQTIEIVDKGDYTREKIMIQTGENVHMPFYLLKPKSAPRPTPVILAFHGHGYGVKDIVGLWEDGEERNSPDGYQKDFAVELCRAGFAVAAPEISCFGERQTDFSFLNTSMGQEVPSSCTHSAMLAFHMGSSVVGMRVSEGIRLVDFLETRVDLDTTRLGAMGISGGGLHTLFSTCLDERIKACVISGYFSTFKDTILAMSHCACNFVPGLGKFGEMYDLSGLLAPRPFLVESGDHDPIFPRFAVEASISRAESVYQVFGESHQIQTDYFEGRHQISGRKAYSFFQSALA